MVAQSLRGPMGPAGGADELGDELGDERLMTGILDLWFNPA
jgi:hypothetical protein